MDVADVPLKVNSTIQVDSELVEQLTEAEALGLVVAQAFGQALAERDLARGIAVRLEQELAEADNLLKRVLECGFTSSWAKDNDVLNDARAWVYRDDS